MQRSGAATRRFYAAFYQWTVRSANPARPCAGVNNVIVPRRRESTTRHVHHAGESTLPASGSSASILPGNWGTAEEREGRLRNDPIQSTADRPIGSLDPWDFAIRERTKNTVTLELQVPTWLLKDDRVLRWSDEDQVRVGIPKNPQNENGFSPVLLSGRFRLVKRAWYIFHRTGFPWKDRQTGLDEAEETESATTTSGKPQSEPSESHKADLEDPVNTETTTSTPKKLQSKPSERHEAQAEVTHNINLPYRLWLALVHHSAVEYYRQDFQVELTALESQVGGTTKIRVAGSVGQVEKAIRELERYRSLSGPDQDQYHIRMRYLVNERAQVIPTAEKASEQLDLWESVVRMRRGEDMSQELCLPESTWQALADRDIVEWLHARNPVRIELGELSKSGRKRSVHLHGKDMQTRRVAQIMRKIGYAGSLEEAVRRLQSAMEHWTAQQNVKGKQAQQVVKQDGKSPQPEPAREQSQDTALDSQVQSEAVTVQKTDDIKGHSSDEARQVIASLGPTNPPPTTSPANDAVAKEQPESNPDMQKSQSDQQQLGDDMRSALRHLTQPVAVILASSRASNQPKDSRSRGVTVSSFCTVTLTPVPIVSFNLRIPSRSWDAIESTGRMRVQLLRASPEGAAVAHAFTLPYEQPHEPFEHLKKLGASIYIHHNNGKTAPGITWDNAFVAMLSAELIPDKCFRVGDHMIVIAKVKKIHRPKEGGGDWEAGALAYGRKAYRMLGEEVKPMERSLESADSTEPASTAAEPVLANVPTHKPQLENTVTHTSTASDPVEITPTKDHLAQANAFQEEAEPDEGTDVDVPTHSGPLKIESTETKPIEMKATAEEPLPDEDKFDNYGSEEGMSDLFERFATADEEAMDMPEGKTLSQAAEPTVRGAQAGSRDISDLGPSSPLLDDDSLRQVLNESETSYASGGLPSQAAAENPALAEALNAVAGAYKDAPDIARSSKPSPAPNDSASPQKVVRSNSALPLKIGHRAWGLQDTNKSTNRSFSSWTSMYTRMYSTSSDKPDPHISDKILKTTVGDYLCEVPQHRKRYAALINTRRRTDRLERELESRDWTPEEAAEMEDEILVARNHIAKELATRNAHDLRAMLDLGRVNSARAQWLESNLEAGQAVLLAEAKLLRTAVYQGRLSSEEFEEKKAKITQDYEEIDTQLMRLKDFVDEDEFDGDGVGGVEGRDIDQDDASPEEDRGEEPVENPTRRGWGLDNSRWS